MKHIYTVVGLVLIVLGIGALTFLKKPPSSPELARVNRRVITVNEFESAYKDISNAIARPPDRNVFLDNLVTKEVLIQEARRRGLDLKEPFRRTIQNYYEQTLLTNLTQERISELAVSVSEEEILSFHKIMGRIYEFRVVKVKTEQEANDAIKDFPSEKADLKTLHPAEFPAELPDEIMSLKAGEVFKKPLCAEEGCLVIRLEGYRDEAVAPLTKLHDEIKDILEARKRKKEMEKWLADLKAKTRIKINEGMLKKEG